MKKPRQTVFYISFIISFLADRISKAIVDKNIPENYSVRIAPYFFLTHIKNPGICFGMLSRTNCYPLLIISSILALVLIILFVEKKTGNFPLFSSVSLGLIEGGILGNLIDRLRFHAVTDFIDLRIWPVFNLADCCIVCGVGFYILNQFKKTKSQEPVIKQ